MNKQELIKRMEQSFPSSQRVYIERNKVLDLVRQLDEPKPLKLKDIISRMRQLFPLSRSEWIDEILHEFGEEFGLMKYREGYEQGRLEGAWVGNQLKDADKIRQELNKPVIPQFIVEFIAEQKKLGHTLSYSIDSSMSDIVAEWYWDNPEPFAIAWILGYTVEKEKWYQVKVKNISESVDTLNRSKSSKYFIIANPEENSLYDTKFTRKELEEAGFGEAFNSPLFEVVEVE